MKPSYIIRTATLNDLKQAASVEALCFPPAEAAGENSIRERILAFPESFLVAEQQGKLPEQQGKLPELQEKLPEQPDETPQTGPRLIGFINGCVTDDAVISDIMFEDISTHNPKGCYQAIFGLDVIPECQHQGIAKDLMNHLIAVAREQGRTGLILTCKDRLIGFYEQFGYKNMGKSASVHGGAVWYDMTLTF